MLTAICFNLDQSKILSSGNGLKVWTNVVKMTWSLFHHLVVDSGKYLPKKAKIGKGPRNNKCPTSLPHNPNF